MDASNTAPQPTLCDTDAIAAAAALFGIKANEARSLGSERDQAFLLLDRGRATAILKVTTSTKGTTICI